MDEVVAATGSDGNVGTVVCDLDGVVYRGSEPITGSGPALAELAARRWRLLFVTNNATKTPEDVAAGIERRSGFPARPDQVITSAMVTAEYLAPWAATVGVVGEQGLVDTIARAGIAVSPVLEVDRTAAVDAVAVGLDRAFDYPRLDAASRLIRAGARLVATNTDATFPTPDGVAPGGGAIVAAIAVAAGRDPEVCGKPHPPTRRAVARRATAPVVVVGDRPETDLAMGKAEGWATVLVLSGVTTDPEAVDPRYRPDLVLTGLAELPEHIDRLVGVTS